MWLAIKEELSNWKMKVHDFDYGLKQIPDLNNSLTRELHFRPVREFDDYMQSKEGTVKPPNSGHPK